MSEGSKFRVKTINETQRETASNFLLQIRSHLDKLDVDLAFECVASLVATCPRDYDLHELVVLAALDSLERWDTFWNISHVRRVEELLQGLSAANAASTALLEMTNRLEVAAAAMQSGALDLIQTFIEEGDIDLARHNLDRLLAESPIDAAVIALKNQVEECEQAAKQLAEQEQKERLRIESEFPPPASCSECGEENFKFVSVSPSIKSVQWRCIYCKRTVRVKRASGRASREPIPKTVQREVWYRDGGRCVQCNGQENLEFDHIIALSRGGANTARNIQLLCITCNRTKGSRPPGEH